jgi:threonine synthase
MRYIGTRDNYPPVSSAEAISLGMVPSGGLFLPESIPFVDPAPTATETYGQTALRVLNAFLDDYTDAQLSECIGGAYNANTFDHARVVGLTPLSDRESALELWHGPTAAFKDVALQIMPLLLQQAKNKLNETKHTVILVATSGDTGKAALEGFKNKQGVSIIVFYPHEGVSEIQKLQMVTTDGTNTHVVGVRGNFDDCQTGVKSLFGDEELGKSIAQSGYAFSSANSINWGRLCPQIVYYYRAYGMLVESGAIQPGDQVNFAVPTGNFGNILSGWYAKRMGLPIHTLLCASNKNNVLSDFIRTGVYDRNRRFYRTISPSMDILISSNLERFLYECADRDAGRLVQWYRDLADSGRFDIGPACLSRITRELKGDWADEAEALETIKAVHTQCGAVIDPHTAVGVAVSRKCAPNDLYTIIDSTASPFKFSGDVMHALTGESAEDEFRSIERLSAISGQPVHRGLADLRQRPVNHKRIIDIDRMRETVLDILGMKAG